MTKKYITTLINTYTKEHNISKSQYCLYPLYVHLDGFSHSIGFINQKPKKNTHYNNYTSVGYSNYTQVSWGYHNIYQQEIAELLFKEVSHLQYQHNAKEILF